MTMKQGNFLIIYGMSQADPAQVFCWISTNLFCHFNPTNSSRHLILGYERSIKVSFKKFCKKLVMFYRHFFPFIIVFEKAFFLLYNFILMNYLDPLILWSPPNVTREVIRYEIFVAIIPVKIK